MRRLKFLTTTFVIFGLFLLFSFPLVFAMRPEMTAPWRERRIFALGLTGLFVLIIVVLALVMICAWKLWRIQTAELADKQMENLKELIEGTLHDHAEKKDES